MTPEWFFRLNDRLWMLITSLVLLLAIILVIWYYLAFPRVRCAAKHLEAPDAVADCYACHQKATPKVAQDWYESKHGLMLVKCYVCHGQPDGKGAVPFAVTPEVRICRECHDVSVSSMVHNYGLEASCVSCHPFHQNSIHHRAYVKPVSKKPAD